MNPYDFVPLDMQHLPEKRTPIWHNTYRSDSVKLYSGYLSLSIQAETPLFIPQDGASMQNPDKAAEHIYNGNGDYILPGSSIKGMLRTVVETLCRGCLTVINRNDPDVPNAFFPCENNTLLCTSCRLFGMISKQKNGRMFLGKVNIGDAIACVHNPNYHGSIYTDILAAPKTHHTAFYFNDDGMIVGRKFYFHNDRLITRAALIPRSDGKGYRNQHIQPLAVGTAFSTRIDFTNLTAEEFAALLFAIQLQKEMRHKIGYGKPLGLGSVQLGISYLQLLNYSNRYKQFHAERGITSYEGQDLFNHLDAHMVSIDPQINDAWNTYQALPSLNELRRIWRWPPNHKIEYAYPGKQWFDTNPLATIRDTKRLPQTM